MDTLLNLKFAKDNYKRKEMETVIQYLDFCSRPHPEKGAKGAICPFLPKALREDVIFCSIVEQEDIDESEIKNILIEGIKNFKQIRISEDLEKYKSLLIIFLTSIPLDNILKKLHQELKPGLIYEGIMIGEFYPSNMKRGLYNSTFYPVVSEVPMIAIRNLVKEDYTFFIDERNSNDKLEFLNGYKYALKDNLNVSELKKVDKAIIETSNGLATQ